MFTGIVETTGRVAEIKLTEAGGRLRIEASPLAAAMKPGSSLAVNGVCLTVVEKDGQRLAFELVGETLLRSNLGDLRSGDAVNLERPLRADGRFDGHIVQGHVDGTGLLESVVPEGDSHRLRLRIAPGLECYLVEKGPVAVDGISLTLAAVGSGWFEVVIIPHTWRQTNLRTRAPGDRVNLEVDLLAKYLEKFLAGRLPGGCGEPDSGK